ncbi:MAG TPA: hypothetical protein VGB76_02075 [Pyrinomonadaceae bacterium]|jgi:hypothetical protein
MAQNGKLELELVDVHGQFLDERVDVMLRHRVLSHFVKKTQKASAKFTIPNLHAEPQGLYRIESVPLSYMPVDDNIKIKGSGTTPYRAVFPVDPKKVIKVNFPRYDKLPPDALTLLSRSDKVLAFEGKTGDTLYTALEKENLKLAGMLNIIAKTNLARLSNGRTVLSYLQELRELRGDRFFVVASKELREETKHSVAEGLFAKKSGKLHHLPAQFIGYEPAGSFKTPDRYGNLQLTFFMKGDDCVADIDIDDASGLQHIFQVLNNMLPGNDTHPYTIHEILIASQKLDPGYTFVL